MGLSISLGRLDLGCCITKEHAFHPSMVGKGWELRGTIERETARSQAEKLGESFPPSYFKPIGS